MRSPMRSPLIALFLLAATPLAAATELPAPVLKGDVVVTSAFVTLGDLIDNAGPNAAQALFHAPELGTDGTIQAWRIAEAAKSLGLENIELKGLRAIRVERSGRAVKLGEITDLVAQEFMKRAAIADRNRVSAIIDPGVGPFLFDAQPQAALSLENFNPDPITGRFDAVLTIRGESGNQKQARITGSLNEIIDALRLRRTISRGEIVNASDITIERIPRSRASNDIAASLSDVVGLSARLAISEGSYLRNVDLEKPRVITRNDPVTIVLETLNMVLSARGKALDGGAVGDVIDVQNVNSKRVVQATILGPGKVSARLNNQRQSTPAPVPVASNQ